MSGVLLNEAFTVLLIVGYFGLLGILLRQARTDRAKGWIATLWFLLGILLLQLASRDYYRDYCTRLHLSDEECLSEYRRDTLP